MPHHFLRYTFLSLNLTLVFVVGSLMSLLAGFKNSTSYSRFWEDRQVYGNVSSASRSFAVLAREYLSTANPNVLSALFARHFAWLKN